MTGRSRSPICSNVGSSSFDAVETMDVYSTAIHDLAAVVPEVVRTILPSGFAKTTFASAFLIVLSFA